jgi:hypothetical protein
MPALVNKTQRQVPIRNYRYVTLPLVSLFKKSSDADAEESFGQEAIILGKYIIRPLKGENGKDTIRNLPVILKPDGSIWRHGSLYLLSRANDYDAPSDQTLKGHAKKLVHFMNTLAKDGIDYLATPKRKGARPTYFYKSELTYQVNSNLLAASTANGRTSSVVNFYRWMQGRHDYYPTEALWKEVRCRIPYQDKKGFYKERNVITTDLRIKITSEESTGEYVVDGGKLYPYSQEQQKAIIQSLIKIDNTEMLLSFLVSNTTGARLSTTFTIRHADVKDPQSQKGSEVAVSIGRGTNVDNKFNKGMTIYIPAWLNAMLYAYINSTRHKRRIEKATQLADAQQYVFLTQHGNPYYISSRDDNRGQTQPIQDGYSIRQFVSKQLQPILDKLEKPFKFRFHNLRACFCMNLIEQRVKNLPNDSDAMFAAIEYVQKKMGHSDMITTQRYFRYRENKKITLQAQNDFELHLQTLAESHVYS